MKFITRTINTYDYKIGALEFENGVLKIHEVGNIHSDDELTFLAIKRAAREFFGKSAFPKGTDPVVMETIIFKKRYRISVEDFVKYAECVEE